MNEIDPEDLDKITLASSQREDCQFWLSELFELLPEKRNRLYQLFGGKDKSLYLVLETELSEYSFKFTDL